MIKVSSSETLCFRRVISCIGSTLEAFLVIHEDMRLV